MVPSQLQMGWEESAAFYCTASQSFTNLSDIIIDEPITMQHLGPHAMESYYFPPIWGEQLSPSKKQKWQLLPTLIPTASALFTVDRLTKKTFIDDYCHLLAIVDKPEEDMLHATRALFHAVHAIFPRPAQSLSLRTMFYIPALRFWFE
jgi:hypothetical protein